MGPRISADHYIGLLAFHREVVIAGAVLLDWAPTRANPGGQMERFANVYTDEAFRGNGIARSLVASILTQFVDYQAEMRRRSGAS